MDLNDKASKPSQILVFRSWVLRHAGMVMVTVLLLVGIVGFALWRPAAKYWHGYVSRSLASQAEAFMKEGNWEKAAPLLEKAYLADPKEPAALHACAYYEEHGAKNLSFSGHFLKQLVDLNLANDEEKATLGRSLMVAGRTKEAQQLHDTLPQSARSTKEALLLESELAMKNGDKTKGEALLRSALSKTPDEPSSVLQLSSLDLDSPLVEIRKNAWQKLWKLANTSSPESLPALSQLNRFVDTTAAQSADLLELASKKPGVPKALRYQIMTVYLGLHPEKQEAALAEETARVTGKPEEEVVPFCQWLTDVGEYDRVLKFSPLDKAVQSARLLPFYINAMLRLGKWAELRDQLANDKRIKLDALSVAELKAKCARGLNQPASVVHDLLDQGKDYAMASRNTGGLDQFSGVALGMGFPDIAVECLRAIVPHSQAHREELLRRIMQIQRSSDDLAGLLTSLREISLFATTPVETVEDYIYLRLISGIELETVMDDSESFAAKGRIRPMAADFFKALAAYRLDEKPALKSALAKLDPKVLPMNWRAIMAGMVSETGDKAKGFQLGEKIPLGALTDDEKRILAEAR